MISMSSFSRAAFFASSSAFAASSSALTSGYWTGELGSEVFSSMGSSYFSMGYSVSVSFSSSVKLTSSFSALSFWRSPPSSFSGSACFYSSLIAASEAFFKVSSRISSASFSASSSLRIISSYFWRSSSAIRSLSAASCFCSSIYS